MDDLIETRRTDVTLTGPCKHQRVNTCQCAGPINLNLNPGECIGEEKKEAVASLSNFKGAEFQCHCVPQARLRITQSREAGILPLASTRHACIACGTSLSAL